MKNAVKMTICWHFKYNVSPDIWKFKYRTLQLLPIAINWISTAIQCISLFAKEYEVIKSTYIQIYALGHVWSYISHFGIYMTHAWQNCKPHNESQQIMRYIICIMNIFKQKGNECTYFVNLIHNYKRILSAWYM